MAIKLSDIQGRSALDLLDKYKGRNPYIKKLKRQYQRKGKLTLTETQTKYIVDNFDKEPVKIDKLVRVTDYLGEELQKQDGRDFIPKKVFIEYMLGETEKSFHVYGKLSTKQKSKMYWLPKTQVLDDPYFQEVDVDIDFEKYTKLDTFELSDGTIGRTPYQHQKEGIKFLLSRKGCILADDMGLGKVIANDVPVLTPNGWVPHGSLKKGDYVIGSNGKPTKVLETYPKPLKDYYNITFTDGTVIESCDEHLWAVQTTNHKKRGSGFKVKALKELMGDLTYGTRGNVKWYIPMVKPVEFNEREVSIDPYVLGCLLGDGGFSSHNIKLSSVDKDLITECQNRLPLGYQLKQIKDSCDYSLTSGFASGNFVGKFLREYGLMGLKSDDKFIPEDYKYNTKEVRLEILQGLLDTDGYCSKKDGTIQFYSVSKQLSDDVKELVQSFGGVARETSKIGKYKKPDGTIVECKLCYILTINLPEDIIPFKLQRKIDNMKTDRKYLPSRGIKSIEFSRKTLGQCIRVEADDHLYVMDKYVVTHNTYQAVIAALETGAERILIVSPSSLKINWEREINYFQCYDTAVVSGTNWKQSKFTIINYDILKNFHTLDKPKKNSDDMEDYIIEFNRQLVKGKFDLVIIDEAHYLKNHKSIRGQIMEDLCVKHGIETVWLLTGTPIANRPMDFYNLLKLIKAPIVDNWVFYAKRYCDGRQITTTLKNGKKKKVWLTNGASNLEELNQRTRNIMLRRKKVDVVDMPDKTITRLPQELTDAQWNEYNNLWETYLEERKAQGKKGNIQRDLVELILLRKFIAMATIPYTIEQAEIALDEGQKVIIFTTFTDELHELQEHFGNKCVVHYGPMNDEEKQRSVDAFQKTKGKQVFIGNIKSAGVGITLTEGTVVIFNSFDWVPGNNEQAEDRAYRIGQKNNVSVYYQLFVNTISEKMWWILQKKREIIATIMGETNMDEEELMLEMMQLLLEDKDE